MTWTQSMRGLHAMAQQRRDPRASGLPPLLALDLHGLSLIEGARAGFAIATVVALGQWVHWPGLMQAALGAMLTCLCDAGGPLRRRLPALLAFAVLGSATTAGFAILRAAPAWALLPATGVVFLASFSRIYGQSAMQVGNLLTVVLVLALRQPLAPAAALAVGGTFLAGSLWAVLLTAVLWRLHPNRPARAAVAETYRMLARLCADLRRLLAADERREWVWDRHARAHRRAVREAIEQARGTSLAMSRAGGAVNGRTAQSWLRVETAEQLFGALIGLSDLAQAEADAAAGAALRARMVRMLRLLEPILLLQGRAILADHEADRPGLDRAIGAVATVAKAGSAARDDATLERIAGFIVERLRLAAFLSDARATLPQGLAASPRRWWRVARAAFAPGSASLRHAVRASLAAGLAVAATMAWPLPYAHWFTITLVLTMQPYFALTFTKAIERIGGTVLGGVLAAALATVATSPVSMSVALFPLAVAALAVRAVSFGLFMVLLTPLVVLLSELGRPGSSEVVIALTRAGFAVAGGGVALALAWLLWPAWEPERVQAELSTAIRAHGRFAAAEIAFLIGEATAAAVAEARRAAGVASNALEASLQRALLEPHRDGTARLQAALTVDAALRRMAGRLTALQVAAAAPERRDRSAWRAWADWLAAATADGLDSAAAPASRPPLPAGDPDAQALARIAGQIEVISGAIRRGE